MRNILERFLNFQADSYWFWGPLIFMRPETPRQLMRLAPIALLMLIGVPLLIVVIGVSFALFLWRWPLAAIAPRHIAATLSAVYGASQLPLMLVVAPLICMMLTLPYVWAWNRRAGRLAKMPPEETPPTVEGVWPPPPRVPKS